MNHNLLKDPSRSNKSPATGQLIVIDGPPGIGVTTQVQRLENTLLNNSIPVRVYSLANSGEIGDDVTKLFTKGATRITGARTSALLALSNTIELTEKNILPSLLAGFTIVCDRYYHLLYVQSLVTGANPDWLHSLFSVAIKPSLTILLDAAPEIIIKRSVLRQKELPYFPSIQSRQASVYEDTVLYYSQLRSHFNDYIDEMNLIVVDATDSADCIAARINDKVVPFVIT